MLAAASLVGGVFGRGQDKAAKKEEDMKTKQAEEEKDAAQEALDERKKVYNGEATGGIENQNPAEVRYISHYMMQQT